MQSSDPNRPAAISQENLTAGAALDKGESCPAQALLRLLAGKWKPEIFRLALDGPLRMSSLLRDLDGANKQTLSVALKGLEESGLLTRTVVRQKPLHIAYTLSDRGARLIPIFRGLEQLSGKEGGG